MGAQAEADRYTVDEIAVILDYLGGVFDEVRLVDPVACKELIIDRSGRIVYGQDCYSKWFDCDRCDNCISEQALISGEKREKFEILGDTLYWVAAKPISICQNDKETPCVLESLISSSVPDYARRLAVNPAVDKALLESRGFYIDWTTKMYNRRYFDESVYLGYLNLRSNLDLGMIVIKVSDKQDLAEAFGGDDRESVFKQLAILIERHVESRDIIIRMADDCFLVIMPEASRESMAKAVSGIEAEAGELLREKQREGTLLLSVGVSWASPFERTDRHARALFREAEENAYLDRRGVRKEWDELDDSWKFSVEDAMEAADATDTLRDAVAEEIDEKAVQPMATATDLADLLDESPDTASDPLVIWLREFAKKDRSRPPERFRFPMPVMGTSYEPGSVQAAIEKIDDATVVSLAKVELGYLRGEFDASVRESESLMESPNDLSVRVAAGLLNSMANMASGHPSFARKAKKRTEDLCEAGIRNSASPRTRAACAIVDSAIVTLFAEQRSSYAPLSEAIKQLPEGQRLYAGYLIALQAFNLGEYGNSLGVVNSALTFSSEMYPIPLAYLHTIAACDYMALREPSAAMGEFEAARRLIDDDGVVSPFVEHYVQLQGLLDASLKKTEPELYRSISKAAEKYRMGWISVVDPAEAEAMGLSPLTASEMTIGTLAARGWTNREIGAHINLSENTVKHRLSSVFQKLGANRRSELSQHWLG